MLEAEVMVGSVADVYYELETATHISCSLVRFRGIWWIACSNRLIERSTKSHETEHE